MARFLNNFSIIVIVLLIVSRSELGNCYFDFEIVGDAIITEARSIKIGSTETLPDSDELSADAEVTTGAGNNIWVGGESEGNNTITGSSTPGPFSESDFNPKVSYPWLCSILHDKKPFCTGTLLRDDKAYYVLTTAFCVYNLTSEDLADVEVDIGFEAVSISKLRQYELSKGPFMTLKVRRSIRHLRFNPSTAYNDIALLQLSKPIIPDESIQPIKLIQPASVINPDTQFQNIIGWREGIDLNDDNIQYWRDQPSKGMSVDECRKTYSDILDYSGISDRMICSGGYTEATSCRWRFGTPLLIKSRNESGLVNPTEIEQIGIFSWGSEALLEACRFNEDKPSPMVFTRISSYYDWIQTFTKHK